MSEVRTRFAPSPTGYMHIGGMRTALFNWLWARHNPGGKFILRIDDTDRQRNNDEALRPILAAFKWLDMGWDEGPEIGGPHGPYFQSQRGEIYQRAADRLLKDKKAYRDFETPAEVQQQREAADKEKRPFISSRKSLELSEAEVQRLVAEGRPHVIRFRVPRGEKVALDDVVRGHVEWDTSLIADPVIMRGDGTPLYNFATVVDDAAMQISHVIRAEEHLSNTPPQILMHQALGHTLPVFAHIPFVTAPGTTKKLSKREIKKYRENPKFRKMFEDADRVFPQLKLGDSETLNPVMVEYYEKIGFLPHAVFNSLARLGWSLDDRTEFMTRKTIVENFTLDRIVKNPAGLDPDKLYSFQAHWMGELPLEEKVTRVMPYLGNAGLIGPAAQSDPAVRDYVSRVVEALGKRLRVASDILEADYFFRNDNEIRYNQDDLDRLLGTKDSQRLLWDFGRRLARVDVWTSGQIRSAVKEIVTETTSPVLSAASAAQLIDSIQEGVAEFVPKSLDGRLLEQEVQEFVRAEGIKIGDIIHTVRLAVTGRTTGPGLYDTLQVLGQKRSVRRIRRVLEQLYPTPYTVDFGSLPEANRPRYAFGKENESIAIHDGKLRLLLEQSFIEVDGQLALEWLPRAMIRFNGTLPVSKRYSGNLKRATLLGAEGWVNTTEAVLTGFAFLSRPQEIQGVATGQLYRGAVGGYRSVTFHLMEFHDYFGSPITDGTGTTWTGRAMLGGMGWKITLDSVEDIADRRAVASQRGGYALTHVGRLEREDKAPFSRNDVHEVFKLLQYYFSFVRGFWVAPLLPVAFDASGVELWRECSLPLIDKHRSVESWFPVREASALQASFEAFATAWTNQTWRKRFESFLYWYLVANASIGALESGIMAAQIALESLWHLHRSTRNQTTGGDLPTPEEMIAELLSAASIPDSIPSDFDDLSRFAHTVNVATGPAAICRLRDMIVHPTEKNLQWLFGMAPLRHVELEVWRLAMWYIELASLHMISYRGRYFSRVRGEWEGYSEPVPWNDGASSSEHGAPGK
jgi:glutamyl-tRNA synthetase